MFLALILLNCGPLASKIMYQIKFGTDGWRGIIAAEFNVENVKRVAYGTAAYVEENHPNNKLVVLGHDCRFGGELFANATAQILCSKGIKVKMAKGFVSTPMISLGAVKHEAALGVIITASHNPAEYNGFKLKAHYGGPSSPAVIDRVEALIPESVDLKLTSIEELVNQGMITYVDLESIYVQEVESKFDLNLIKKSGLEFAYDAMYGAGQTQCVDCSQKLLYYIVITIQDLMDKHLNLFIKTLLNLVN